MGKHFNKIVDTTLMGALLLNNYFCMASGNEAISNKSERKENTSSVSKKSSLWWWATLPIVLFSTIWYKLRVQKEIPNDNPNNNLDNDQVSDDSYNSKSDYSDNDQVPYDNDNPNKNLDNDQKLIGDPDSSNSFSVSDNEDNDQNSIQRANDNFPPQNMGLNVNLNQDPQNVSNQFSFMNNPVIKNFVDSIASLSIGDIENLRQHPNSMSQKVISTATYVDENVGTIVEANQNLTTPEIGLLSGIVVTALSITDRYKYNKDTSDNAKRQFLENYLLAEICRLKAELPSDLNNNEDRAILYEMSANFYGASNGHPYGDPNTWPSERCTNELSVRTCIALSKMVKGQDTISDISSIRTYFNTNKNSVKGVYAECYGTNNPNDTLHNFIKNFVEDPKKNWFGCLYAARDCATLIRLDYYHS